eukprot:Awhi_evm1s7042
MKCSGLFYVAAIVVTHVHSVAIVNRRSSGSCHLASGQYLGFKVFCDQSTTESLCKSYPYCAWEASDGAPAVPFGQCSPKAGFEAFAVYCGSPEQATCQAYASFVIGLGSISRGEDEFCTGTEGLILLTDTKIDIMGSNGAITSCATGLFSAVNAVMDSKGGLYVVEDMGQTVKYIAPN